MALIKAQGSFFVQRWFLCSAVYFSFVEGPIPQIRRVEVAGNVAVLDMPESHTVRDEAAMLATTLDVPDPLRMRDGAAITVHAYNQSKNQKRWQRQITSRHRHRQGVVVDLSTSPPTRTSLFLDAQVPRCLADSEDLAEAGVESLLQAMDLAEVDDIEKIFEKDWCDVALARPLGWNMEQKCEGTSFVYYRNMDCRPRRTNWAARKRRPTRCSAAQDRMSLLVAQPKDQLVHSSKQRLDGH